MKSFLKPLGNLGFSWKVGGGFATMIVLAGTIGAVGTLSILELRDQNQVTSQASTVMASLQEVAAQREAFLLSKELAMADTIRLRSGDLVRELDALAGLLDPDSAGGKKAEMARASVADLSGEFDTVLKAVIGQNTSMQKMEVTTAELEKAGLQVSALMAAMAEEANAVAAEAASTRAQASAFYASLADIKRESDGMADTLQRYRLASMATGDDAASKAAELIAQARAHADALIRSSEVIAGVKIEGIDPKKLEQMKTDASKLTGNLDDMEKASSAVKQQKYRSAVGTRTTYLAKAADELNVDVAKAVETSRAKAEAAIEQATRVRQVAGQADALVRETYALQASTLNFLNKMGQNELMAVEDHLVTIRDLGEKLATGAAVFPKVTDATQAIQASIETFEGDFEKLSAAADAFEGAVFSLTMYSQEVRDNISQVVAAQLAASSRAADMALIGIGSTLVIAIAFGVLLATVLSLVITRPTRALTMVMGRLADGDTDVEIPHTDQKDEIGAMSRTVQVFRDNALERIRLEELDEERQQNQVRRQRDIDAMIVEFRDNVQAVLSSLDATAREMDGTASALSTLAASSSEQASNTAEASLQASMNVENVAGAAEELSASISEISSQVERTSSIVSRATSSVQDTNGKVQHLAEAAGKIGEVVTLIQAIAEQTNLLALNATIEAARAGDAGKGFAVVAAEVKELANQTSRATEEISTQISAIQGSTSEAVNAIAAISETMNEVNSYTQAIASAVTQQGAATEEISTNVLRASEGTRAVQANMESLSRAVEETQQASGTVLSAAGHLGERGHALRNEVEGFLARVASA
ncbi:methyl-accepting chemotaxis protein [Roseibium aestuarii]|uniref:Methyl-accepting chemotaxis protein n=1 Tax=Roseibium aestuarii TaxID=2600299 RepID=A0ABW4JU90_9HYPH|nr:methyl-accepting chemotaxis protein [Roseibium aestuarii]